MSRSRSYTITSLQQDDTSLINAEVVFDPAHPIYAGHFPGNPVTPGVCIVGMVGDILNEALAKECVMTEARFIKFHNPLKPDPDHSVKVTLTCKGESGQLVDIKAVVSDQVTKYCTLNASYRIAT